MKMASLAVNNSSPDITAVPWWVTILLGVLTLALPTAAYFASTRATRLQVAASHREAEHAREAQRLAVDAAAYDRARQMYEAAISLLKDQVDDLTSRIATLSEEVHRLRSANEKLEREVIKWRGAADELRVELQKHREEP